MEHRQFDRWTRLFAGTSRRGSIKLLLAGVATGPLAVTSARDAMAQVATEACGKDGDRCTDNSDCCNKFKCKNDKCRNKDDNTNCGKDGDHCDNNGDRCNKFKCKNDKCRKKSNDDSCGKDGDRCDNDGDCCNKFRCKNDRCR
jgi:hypothetical protein